MIINNFEDNMNENFNYYLNIKFKMIINNI